MCASYLLSPSLYYHTCLVYHHHFHRNKIYHSIYDFIISIILLNNFHTFSSLRRLILSLFHLIFTVIIKLVDLMSMISIVEKCTLKNIYLSGKIWTPESFVSKSGKADINTTTNHTYMRKIYFMHIIISHLQQLAILIRRSFARIPQNSLFLSAVSNLFTIFIIAINFHQSLYKTSTIYNHVYSYKCRNICENM